MSVHSPNHLVERTFSLEKCQDFWKPHGKLLIFVFSPWEYYCTKALRIWTQFDMVVSHVEVQGGCCENTNSRCSWTDVRESLLTTNSAAMGAHCSKGIMLRRCLVAVRLQRGNHFSSWFGLDLACITTPPARTTVSNARQIVRYSTWWVNPRCPAASQAANPRPSQYDTT